MTDLPIHAALPELLGALRDAPNAVLVAPPGAGKTTAVAPALLAEPWCSGRVVLTSPRRLAARAAAERMAELAGQPVGRTIGYATRMDSRQSAATRILVVTEGILVRMLQDDPELAGTSALLFDEVHERSLDGDFGLALALEAQAAFRPELRLCAMSATLDGARFAALLGGEAAPAPVIESEGRSHPLTLHHIGRRADRPIEDEVAAAIRRALVEAEGDLLAFLPGVREIERTAERLGDLGVTRLHLLHGQRDPASQRAAIRRDPEGRRKVVLTTAIAETSLTIDGVRIVVDSGLARRPRHDRMAGVTRLVTERASQAAVTQRAGRAARQGPGVAYRLWEEAATRGLPRFDTPELLESDLAPLLLDCAAWGEADPAALRWLDPPPAAGLADARKRLLALGAIDDSGAITAHGRRLAALPMAPHLAHMLVRAGAAGQGRTAAELIVLLQERGLGGRGEDLEARLARFRAEPGGRAEAARQLAGRWAGLVESGAPGTGPAGGSDIGPIPPAVLLALAFPDRLARRRDASGEHWLSAGGRAFRLDPASPLARRDWLAIAEVQGAASGARVLSAIGADAAEVEAHAAERIETRRELAYDRAADRVEARRVRRLGAITLASGPDSDAAPEAIADALLAAVRAHGLGLLPLTGRAEALRQRAWFAGLDALEDAALLGTIELWLAPLLAGRRRLGDLPPERLAEALEGLLDWDARQALDRLAPPHFTSPAGTRHAIDYAAEAGPTVELRVQALFGLDRHPCVGSRRIPLVLSLTSPAGRPIQTTRDLPAFWRGSWADVAKDMRGRYPRHVWPDDPAAATPSLKTRNALARETRGG